MKLGNLRVLVVGRSGYSLEIAWDDQGQVERWVLDSGIAPVYPKLRLSVRSLLTLAELVSGTMESMAGPDRAASLRVDFRYERAGEYLSRLSGRVRDPSSAVQFCRRVVLSRWCAVMRWKLGDEGIVEFVYDTTDVVRKAAMQNRELLRAVVCLSEAFRTDVTTIATAFDVLHA